MFCASIFSGDRCGKDFPFSLSMSWEYRIMVTISVYPLLAAEYSDDQPFCPQRFMICKVSKAYSTEDKSIHVPSSVCWGQPRSPVALRRILFGCWWPPTSRPFVDPRYIVYYAKIKNGYVLCKMNCLGHTLSRASISAPPWMRYKTIWAWPAAAAIINTVPLP